MSERSEFAVSRFNGGFNCAQSVLAAYCEELGLDMDTAMKLSCGFGGGMAQTDEACGAVTGALMLIGLKFGKYRADDAAAKERTYRLVEEFSARFKAKYGSVRCSDLIRFDLSKKDGREAARESGVFKSICPKLVAESVEIVESLLDSPTA